jgi:hypothetical protein
METRALTDAERSLLDFLLSKQFAGRDALLRQAETVPTGGSSCGCGCPSFSLVPDRSLPAADLPDRVPSEAHGVDPGGNSVGVDLYADDGYLSDVEVFAWVWEGTEFAGLPDPSALKISEWSEPNSPGGVQWLLNP